LVGGRDSGGADVAGEEREVRVEEYREEERDVRFDLFVRRSVLETRNELAAVLAVDVLPGNGGERELEKEGEEEGETYWKAGWAATLRARLTPSMWTFMSAGWS
jgi:hypothetical protein